MDANLIRIPIKQEVTMQIEIPARRGRAIRVGRHKTIKVVNTHGSQVVDFWVFSSRVRDEFMSMEHTRPMIRKLTPVPGDQLWTNRRRAILSVLEDTTRGVHDTTVAACCPNRYKQLGVNGYHESCQENLFAALAELGREPPEVPCPFNLFQNSQYHPRHGLAFAPPTSKPGQYISFKAEMDCVAVFSCCPMDVFPLNGEGPTDAHVEVL